MTQLSGAHFFVNFAKFLPKLGHNLVMSCEKFQVNRFRIDREIDANHALQIIVS